MRLSEAMSMLRSAATVTKATRRWHLVVSFEPLHLVVFLRAWHRKTQSETDLEIVPGSYGSLAQNLDNALHDRGDGCVVLMSWEDIDPRLSWRGNGAFGELQRGDFSQEASRGLKRVAEACKQLAATRPVLWVPPVLPLPPFDVQGSLHSGPVRAQLKLWLAELAAELSAVHGITCVDGESLAKKLPHRRQDMNHLFASGFPFTIEACSALAQVIVECMSPPEPLRGLITDLDHTLWKGVVGEDGVDGISWDLDGKAQQHGLYQRLLAVLAESGVLLGVASRNDPAVVEKAFQRKDLLIKPERFFPALIHWDSKVESVRRILKIWNIGAGHVLFIDDDQREVERIKEAFPGIHGRVFPAPAQGVPFDEFVTEVRDLFARAQLTEEDMIRAMSIRAHAVPETPVEGFDEDIFHQSLQARLVIFDARQETDDRSLALVLKTNQFNMNGFRPAPTEWAAALGAQNALALTFAYEDRYGPLGRIAVMVGTQADGIITLSHWVMSCRAFNRRIEHACLFWLFETTGAHEIHTTALRTDRNSVFFNVLDACGVAGDGIIRRETFEKIRPQLSFAFQTA